MIKRLPSIQAPGIEQCVTQSRGDPQSAERRAEFLEDEDRRRQE